MGEEILGLVRRAQQGDSAAFTELVVAQSRLAAGIAYSILNDTHLAADAVQDAVLRAFQKLHQLNEPDAFVSWFLNTVRASSIDLLRKRRKSGVKERSLLYDVAGSSKTGAPVVRQHGASSRDVLVAAEDAHAIREALEILPQDYREVIILKHLEGRSYREIARLLKTSVRSVESKLFRARQLLSNSLRARGVHHPGMPARPAAPAGDVAAESDSTAQREESQEPAPGGASELSGGESAGGDPAEGAPGGLGLEDLPRFAGAESLRPLGG